MVFKMKIIQFKMIKEFHAVIHRTPEECRHIIINDLRNVRPIGWLGLTESIYGRSKFIDDYEFHVSIPRAGRIVGTLIALEQDQTEIKGQLRVGNCFRINTPLAILMTLMMGVLAIAGQLPILCPVVFVVAALPLMTVMGNMVCNHVETRYQRIVEIFLETLKDPLCPNAF